MKISTVGRGQARWMSTRTAVRESLYEAQRSMTIEELVDATDEFYDLHDVACVENVSSEEIVSRIRSWSGDDLAAGSPRDVPRAQVVL